MTKCQSRNKSRLDLTVRPIKNPVDRRNLVDIRDLSMFFSQTTETPRDRSPHTDESTSRQKVVLRSKSEIRRDHHRTDLTAWKTLTVPSPDTIHNAQIPDWARQPTHTIWLCLRPVVRLHLLHHRHLWHHKVQQQHHLCPFFFDTTEIRSSMCTEHHQIMRRDGI